MSVLKRVTSGVRTVATNPVGRRAYAARFKWLVKGSGSLPAWSLEYRAGLTGRFEVDVERSMPDEQELLRCPTDCAANAPLSHLYETRYVYRLHHTVTNTATGATLVTKPGQLPFFVRESITWPFESILSHGLDIPEPRDARQGPAGATTIFPTSPNYYHWLIEELPLVLRANDVAPDATCLAYEPAMTERHRIVARELNLQLQPAPLVVRLKDHVLPGRGDDSWFLHPADARRLFDLGERLAASQPIDSSRRIYVSRRLTTRSHPHETEIEVRLRRAGWSIVHLENTPWVEQIALFRNARIVAGLHGAGFSNLVFTPPGARLIELTNGLHYNRCFEWIAHVCGHEYRMAASDDRDGITGQALAQAVLDQSADITE